MSWTAVQNASGYQYSFDGSKWEDLSPSVLSLDLSKICDAGNYTFMVRAKGNGLNYKTGAYSSLNIVLI